MNGRFLAGLGILSAVVLVGCGGGEKKKPAAPCAVGVNASKCSVEMTGTSNWVSQYDVYSSGDPKTRKIERRVTVIQKFEALEDGRKVWSRSSTITDGNGDSQTMIIQGRVLSIDKTVMSVTIDNTTCDGINQGFVMSPASNANGGRDLYYQRSGNGLRLRTSPFPPPVKTSGGVAGALMGALMQGIAQGIADVMVDIVVQTLTFGRLHDELKEGQGHYVGVHPLKMGQGRLALGKIGCFSRGGQFIANDNLASWQ